MSFLNTADDMADNAMKVMKDVLDSKFTTFIQNVGTPILVTYYNLNDVMTTVDTGTENIDSELGEHSPLRFNKILNFPLYGLGNGGSGLIPSKDDLEGGLIDLSIDLELVMLPNAIKPSGYDYFVYKYQDGTNITFKVNDFEMSTIKNNNYYKISVSLKDINDTVSEEKLEKQTVDELECILDRFGSSDRCVVRRTIYDKIEDIEKVIEYITEQYIDTFYVNRYRAVCYRRTEDSAIVYDPYLTKFLIDNHIMDYQKSRYITLVNHDTRDEVLRNYNKSIYRNVELRDKTKTFVQLRTPVVFSTSTTNPFSYYGEDVAFTLDLLSYGLDDDIKEEDMRTRAYVPWQLMDKIRTNEMVGEWEKFESTEDEVTPLTFPPMKKPEDVCDDIHCKDPIHKHHHHHHHFEDLKHPDEEDDKEYDGHQHQHQKELYKMIPKTTEEDLITNEDEDELIENVTEDDVLDNGDYSIKPIKEKPEHHQKHDKVHIDHRRCVLHDNRSTKEYFFGTANVTLEDDSTTSQYNQGIQNKSRIPDTSIFGKDENKYSQFYWNLIITYINKGNLMDLLERSNVSLEDLLRITIENDYESLIYLPIVLYILHDYVTYLKDNG